MRQSVPEFINEIGEGMKILVYSYISKVNGVGMGEIFQSRAGRPRDGRRHKASKFRRA